MKSSVLFLSGLMAVSAGATTAGTGLPSATILIAQAAMSPDQAAAVARNRTGGRVLGVDWGESGGQPVYLVKVLMPDGSIRVVPVAASGGR